MMKTTQSTSETIMEEPVMETETSRAKPILQVAWARFSELDVNALDRTKSHLNKRKWIAVFSVLATLLALLGQGFQYKPGNPESASLIGLTFS